MREKKKKEKDKDERRMKARKMRILWTKKESGWREKERTRDGKETRG